MLKIILQEFETNEPDKGNFYYLRGELDESGFSGWSDFVVAEIDLVEFVENLKSFASDLQGSPVLNAGWGEETYFRLGFEKWKSTGNIWVSGELAYPINVRIVTNPRCSHRFTFGFPSEPGLLDNFVKDLNSLIKQEKKESILDTTTWSDC